MKFKLDDIIWFSEEVLQHLRIQRDIPAPNNTDKQVEKIRQELYDSIQAIVRVNSIEAFRASEILRLIFVNNFEHTNHNETSGDNDKKEVLSSSGNTKKDNEKCIQDLIRFALTCFRECKQPEFPSSHLTAEASAFVATKAKVAANTDPDVESFLEYIKRKNKITDNFRESSPSQAKNKAMFDVLKPVALDARNPRQKADSNSIGFIVTEMTTNLILRATLVDVHGFQVKAKHLFKSRILQTAISFILKYNESHDDYKKVCALFRNYQKKNFGKMLNSYANELFYLVAGYGSTQLPIGSVSYKAVAPDSGWLYSINEFKKMLDDERDNYSKYVPIPDNADEKSQKTTSPSLRTFISRRCECNILGQINYLFYILQEINAIKINKAKFGMHKNVIDLKKKMVKVSNPILLATNRLLFPDTFEVIPKAKYGMRHSRIDATTIWQSLSLNNSGPVPSLSNFLSKLGPKIGNSFTTNGVTINVPFKTKNPLPSAADVEKSRKYKYGGVPMNQTLNSIALLPPTEHAYTPPTVAPAIAPLIVEALKKYPGETAENIARALISNQVLIDESTSKNLLLSGSYISTSTPGSVANGSSIFRLGSRAAVSLSSYRDTTGVEEYQTILLDKFNDSIQDTGLLKSKDLLIQRSLNSFQESFAKTPDVTNLVIHRVNSVVDPKCPHLEADPTAIMTYTKHGKEWADFIKVQIGKDKPPGSSNDNGNNESLLSPSEFTQCQWSMGIPINSNMEITLGNRNVQLNGLNCCYFVRAPSLNQSSSRGTPSLKCSFFQVFFRPVEFKNLYNKVSLFAFSTFYPLVEHFVTELRDNPDRRSGAFVLPHDIPYKVVRMDLLSEVANDRIIKDTGSEATPPPDNANPPTPKPSEYTPKPPKYTLKTIEAFPNSFSAIHGLPVGGTVPKDDKHYKSFVVIVDESKSLEHIISSCCIIPHEHAGLGSYIPSEGIPSEGRGKVVRLTPKGHYMKVDESATRSSTDSRPLARNTPFCDLNLPQNAVLCLIDRLHDCRLLSLDRGKKDLLSVHEVDSNGKEHLHTYSHSQWKFESGIKEARQVVFDMEEDLRTNEYMSLVPKGNTSVVQTKKFIEARISSHLDINKVQSSKTRLRLQHDLKQKKKLAMENAFKNISNNDPTGIRYHVPKCKEGCKKGECKEHGCVKVAYDKVVARDCYWLVGDAFFDATKRGSQSAPVDEIFNTLYRVANPNHVMLIDEYNSTRSCADCGSPLAEVKTFKESSYWHNRNEKQEAADDYCMSKYDSFLHILRFGFTDFESTVEDAKALARRVERVEVVSNLPISGNGPATPPAELTTDDAHFATLQNAMNPFFKALAQARIQLNFDGSFIPNYQVVLYQITKMQQKVNNCNLDIPLARYILALCKRTIDALKAETGFLQSNAVMKNALIVMEEGDEPRDNSLREYDVRGLRRCSNDKCKNSPFKNRDENAAKNFLLLRESMMRGNDPPAHLATHHRAAPIAPFNLERDRVTQKVVEKNPAKKARIDPASIQAAPTSTASIAVQGGTGLALQAPPLKRNQRKTKPTTEYFHIPTDEDKLTEEQAHNAASGAFGIPIERLVPVRHFVHQNVKYENKKGRYRPTRVLVPRYSGQVNHLRPQGSSNLSRGKIDREIAVIAKTQGKIAAAHKREEYRERLKSAARRDFIVGEFRVITDPKDTRDHPKSITVIASYKKHATVIPTGANNPTSERRVIMIPPRPMNGSETTIPTRSTMSPPYES